MLLHKLKQLIQTATTALQLAIGDKKAKHSVKAEVGHYAKASTAPKKFTKEFRNYSIAKSYW